MLAAVTVAARAAASTLTSSAMTSSDAPASMVRISSSAGP
jgi:hypothetical protein